MVIDFTDELTSATADFRTSAPIVIKIEMAVPLLEQSRLLCRFQLQAYQIRLRL